MVDLHTHSTASDGRLSPEELIQEAHNAGLKAIALTDHDTLDGLKNAQTAAANFGIHFIPGIELEACFHGKGKCHVLGLGIKKPENMADFLEKARQERTERNQRIIRKMNNAGILVTIEEINKLARGKIIGSPHFAQWLIRQGMAKNTTDAFNQWLGVGRPYYSVRESPSIKEVFDAIHRSGAKAIIAHPPSLMMKWSKLFQWLLECRETGLDGIEAYHSGNNLRMAKKLEKTAGKLGMIITGGSDFHEHGTDRILGRGPEGQPLCDNLLRPF